MKNVINPCRIDTGNKFKAPVYVAIDFDEEGGNLSLTGVVGPLASGNCTGSCGQIADELLDESRTMSLGWTPEMVDDLVAVWKEWHLNDMTPGSPRQMEFLRGKRLSYEAGCDALADAGILDDEEFWYDNATRMQVQPTEEQRALWAAYAKARGMSIPTFQTFHAWVAKEYGTTAAAAITATPYHYGSAWLKRDVPKYIIDELRSLPAATRQPAWV